MFCVHYLKKKINETKPMKRMGERTKKGCLSVIDEWKPNVPKGINERIRGCNRFKSSL